MVSFRCKKCLWFDQQHKSLPKDDPDLGYCRKHKPSIFQEQHGGENFYRGGWPLVDVADLCGEFREDQGV